MRIRAAANVALTLFILACSSEGDGGGDGPGSAGTPSFGGVGFGGALATGGSAAGSPATPIAGTVATGGTGGAPASMAGAPPVAGAAGTPAMAGSGQGGSGGAAGSGSGGTPAGSGGTQATAGTGPKAGSGGMGGKTSMGGSSGASPGGAGSGTGGSGSGMCQKGTTKGNEVLFIGESFVAASSIPEETTKLARAAGSLGANDSYVDKSVSGTWIGNGAANSIPNQYKNNSNGVRFVLMNGGGNDCWQGGQESHRTAALNAAKTLFQEMGTKGVEKVVYFFYPDPVGASFNSLKACLDLLRPAMKSLCDAQTSPKCYWVDLRETWNGHNEYTSDGIHVAGPGNVPTATAIWKSMEANCVAP